HARVARAAVRRVEKDSGQLSGVCGGELPRAADVRTAGTTSRRGPSVLDRGIPRLLGARPVLASVRVVPDRSNDRCGRMVRAGGRLHEPSTDLLVNTATSIPPKARGSDIAHPSEASRAANQES